MNGVLTRISPWSTVTSTPSMARPTENGALHPCPMVSDPPNSVIPKHGMISTPNTFQKSSLMDGYKTELVEITLVFARTALSYLKNLKVLVRDAAMVGDR